MLKYFFDQWRGSKWGWLAALLLAVGLIYARPLNAPLFWDDLYYFADNPQIKKVQTLYSLFSQDYFQNTRELTWRPWPTTVTVLAHQLFKNTLWGYRLINLSAHLINVWLFGCLCAKLWKDQSKTVARFSMALFALHPVQIGTVLCFTFSEDLWVTLFLLSALIAHINFRQRQTPAPLLFSATALLFGLLSKESALMFIALAGTYDWLYVRPTSKNIRALLAAYAAYSAIIIGHMSARFLLMGAVGGNPLQSNSDTLVWRLASAIKLIALSLRAFIFPGEPKIQSVILPVYTAASALLWAAAFILPLTLYLYGVKRQKIHWSSSFKFFILWALLTLLPVSNIIPFDHSYRLADRFLYLPSLGLCGIAGLIFARWNAFKPEWSIKSISLILGMVFIIALVRAQLFTNEIALSQAAVRQDPLSSAAHYTLAASYIKQVQYREALNSLKTALNLRLSKKDEVVSFYDARFKDRGIALKSFPQLADIYNAFGHTYAQIGQSPLALNAYQQAIDDNPKLVLPYANMAKIYNDSGHWQNAQTACKKALELDPNLETAWNNLAVAYNGKGEPEEALKAAQKCLTINPKNYLALINLGIAQFNMKQPRLAEENFRKALEIDPKNIFAMHNLAIIALLGQRPKEAIYLYKQILNISPQDAQAKNNLIYLLK